MNTTNPNDTAFPAYEPDYKMGHPIQQLTEAGLSKREYFAGLALQGWIASCTENAPIKIDAAANFAVKAADALIKQLNENNNETV